MSCDRPQAVDAFFLVPSLQFLEQKGEDPLGTHNWTVLSTHTRTHTDTHTDTQKGRERERKKGRELAMSHRVTPSSRTWTLRFKHNTRTVLLEVDPLQKLSDVRAELLHALVETNPDGTFNGKEIPKNADHIQLGSANDRNDLSKGYTSLSSDFEQIEESGKGKGKATAGKAKPGSSSAKDCPQGVGLKNGDIVAFKFAGDDGVPGDEDEILEQWDVVVPSIEETYREDDEGVDMDEG